MDLLNCDIKVLIEPMFINVEEKIRHVLIRGCSKAIYNVHINSNLQSINWDIVNMTVECYTNRYKNNWNFLNKNRLHVRITPQEISYLNSLVIMGFCLFPCLKFSENVLTFEVETDHANFDILKKCCVYFASCDPETTKHFEYEGQVLNFTSEETSKYNTFYQKLLPIFNLLLTQKHGMLSLYIGGVPIDIMRHDNFAYILTATNVPDANSTKISASYCYLEECLF